MGEWVLFLPELILISGVMTLLLVECFMIAGGGEWRYDAAIAFIVMTLLAVIGMAWVIEKKVVLWQGQWVIDGLAICSKGVICSLLLLILTLQKHGLMAMKIDKSSSLALWLLSGIGAMVCCSTMHFASFFLSMGLMYLPLYMHITLGSDKKNAIEAAMKYMIMGLLMGGIMIYAASLLYALTGSLNIEKIAIQLQRQSLGEWASWGSYGFDIRSLKQGVFFAATTLMFIGFCFKLGVAPFHHWVPDVYESSRVMVLSVIGMIPKWAICVLWVRVMGPLFGAGGDLWQWACVFVGLYTVIFGHINAIRQEKISRLLAYASMSQTGYVLMALGLNRSEGFEIAFAYLGVYIVSLLILLTLLARVGVDFEKKGDGLIKVEQLLDLNTSDKVKVFLLLLSFAGLPPSAGFMVKLYWARVLAVNGWSMTAIMGIAFSLLGIIYYLYMIGKMTFLENRAQSEKMESSEGGGVFLGFFADRVRMVESVLLSIILSLGIFPVFLFNGLKNLV